MKKSQEGILGPGKPRRTPKQPAFDHPYVAAVLDDLRRDWPFIARCAENPLTEFFLLRDRRRGFRLRQIPLGLFVWSAAWVAAMVALMVFYNYFGAFVALFCCGLERFLHKKIFKKYVREIAEPIDILDETDRGKLEHLYLAPIHFRSLLGACAVYYYAHWRRYLAGLLFVIAGVMCFFLALAAYCIGLDAGFHKYTLPSYIGIVAIFVRIARLVARPEFIMGVGVRNLYAKLIEMSDRIVARREAVFMQQTWIVLALTPLVSLLVIFGTHSFWVWIVLLIVACFYQCSLAEQKMAALVRDHFADYADDGERLYAELIESEDVTIRQAGAAPWRQ